MVYIWFHGMINKNGNRFKHLLYCIYHHCSVLQVMPKRKGSDSCKQARDEILKTSVLVADEVVKVIVDVGGKNAGLRLVLDGDLEDIRKGLVEDSLSHVALEEAIRGKGEVLLSNNIASLVVSFDGEDAADGNTEGGLNGTVKEISQCPLPAKIGAQKKEHNLRQNAAKVDGLWGEGGTCSADNVVGSVENGGNNL